MLRGIAAASAAEHHAHHAAAAHCPHPRQRPGAHVVSCNGATGRTLLGQEGNGDGGGGTGRECDEERAS